MVCHAVFLAELDFCGLILVLLFVAEHSTVIQNIANLLLPPP